ncbi:MAG: 6-carboxytetrahydropterin synthase [Thermoplasmata archaeon]
MREIVRVEIDYAHRLMNHSGKCSRLHGHTSLVMVEIEGNPDEKTSMIIDFNDIKDVIKRNLDHRTLLNKDDPIKKFIPKEWVVEFNGDPTVENILLYIRDVLLKNFNITMIEVREGSGGVVRWRRE